MFERNVPVAGGRRSGRNHISEDTVETDADFGRFCTHHPHLKQPPNSNERLTPRWRSVNEIPLPIFHDKRRYVAGDRETGI